MTIARANNSILRVISKGGGGGGGGTILEIDFTNYAKPNFSIPYIYPNIGKPIYWYKGYLNNIRLTTNGLEVGNFTSTNIFQSIPLYGFSGKKLRLYQKSKGVSGGTGGDWSRCGLFCNVYTNTYTPSRGMGAVIASELIQYGSFLNGHSANWGFTEQGEPYSSMLIVPETRLYPITDVTIETEIIFDFEVNGILYRINNIDAFKVENLSDELFNVQLCQCMKFYIGASNNKILLQHIKIESLD